MLRLLDKYIHIANELFAPPYALFLMKLRYTTQLDHVFVNDFISLAISLVSSTVVYVLKSVLGVSTRC